MRKTDRKTENLIIRALTEACEIALERFDGFRWLTHFVDYQRFPASLTIVCVFDTNTEENCREENHGKWRERFRDGHGALHDVSVSLTDP